MILKKVTLKPFCDESNIRTHKHIKADLLKIMDKASLIVVVSGAAMITAAIKTAIKLPQAQN